MIALCNPCARAQLHQQKRARKLCSEDTLQKARTFNKTMLKTARHRRHLHFNHRCKDLQVLPPSLRIQPPVRTTKGWKLSKTVGFQFLKLRIEDTHKKIRTLTREKELALDFLRSRLTTSDLEHLETLVYEQQKEEYSRIRSVHSKRRVLNLEVKYLIAR